MTYQQAIAETDAAIANFGQHWDGIEAEPAARMRLQNRFHTGLDIARYTAKIMRADMAAYDADPAQYTQSLGCWHGFIGQQKLIAIKSISARPKAAICICRAGWSPRCAVNSGHCPTSRCTRKRVFLRWLPNFTHS